MGVRVRVEGYEDVDAELGATLLEVCEGAAIPITSACGGFAACNSCRVDVIDGLDRLSACAFDEQAFLDAPTHRLACQARLLGPVSVRLAPGA